MHLTANAANPHLIDEKLRFIECKETPLMVQPTWSTGILMLKPGLFAPATPFAAMEMALLGPGVGAGGHVGLLQALAIH